MPHDTHAYSRPPETHIVSILVFFKPELKGQEEMMNAYLDEYLTAGMVLAYAPMSSGQTQYCVQVLKGTETSFIEAISKQPGVAQAVIISSDPSFDHPRTDVS